MPITRQQATELKDQEETTEEANRRAGGEVLTNERLSRDGFRVTITVDRITSTGSGGTQK